MITRWDADLEARCMFNCSDGDYVLFDDYDNLCREFDDLKEKYDNLVKAIGELYQEA